MHPWDSVQTLVPLTLGVVGLVGFGFYIVYVPPYLGCDPFLRPSLFCSCSGIVAYMTTTIQWMIMWTA